MRLPGRGGDALPAAPAAGRRFFFDDATPSRLGDGVVAICTAASCLVARFKPGSGDLVMMYNIPRPSDATMGTLPCAAWLPHHRRQQAILQHNADMTMPCAVLAVGWERKLVLLAVPLVGDHVLTEAAQGGLLDNGGINKCKKFKIFYKSQFNSTK